MSHAPWIAALRSPLRLESLAPLLLVVAAMPGREAAAQSTVLRWNIEATVSDVFDPDGVFPDVQLGDPVRGFLSYDLATPPDLSVDPNGAYYYHDSDFAVAGMVIENPRGGDPIAFPADAGIPFSELLTFAGVADDLDDDLLGLHDGVFGYQTVTPPAGFSGLVPLVEVALTGPTDVLSDLSLPAALDLAPWTAATITFGEAFEIADDFADPASSYVVAAIHALTLVPEPGGVALAAIAAAACSGLIGRLRAPPARRP